MITAQQIVETAREYLGTPYHHQARLKGKGVDCIGLLVGVAKDLGLPHHDRQSYPRTPDGTLVGELSKTLEPVAREDARTGDVVSFWIMTPGVEHHVGILTPRGVIHTFTLVRKVVEHGLNEYWLQRITRVWRWPGAAAGASVDLKVPDPQDKIPATHSVTDEIRRLRSGCCDQPRKDD